MGEEAPPKSLSFCHHAQVALARWEQNEKTGVIFVLDDFSSSAFAAFEVANAAKLSAELCIPDLRRYHTTLRCTESIHVLWPLNRKFSGLLVRP